MFKMCGYAAEVSRLLADRFPAGTKHGKPSMLEFSPEPGIAVESFVEDLCVVDFAPKSRVVVDQIASLTVRELFALVGGPIVTVIFGDPELHHWHDKRMTELLQPQDKEDGSSNTVRPWCEDPDAVALFNQMSSDSLVAVYGRTAPAQVDDWVVLGLGVLPDGMETPELRAHAMEHSLLWQQYMLGSWPATRPADSNLLERFRRRYPNLLTNFGWLAA